MIYDFSYETKHTFKCLFIWCTRKSATQIFFICSRLFDASRKLTANEMEKSVHLESKRNSNSTVLSEDNSCVVYCRGPQRKIQGLQQSKRSLFIQFSSCRVCCDETTHPEQMQTKPTDVKEHRNHVRIFSFFRHTEIYSRGYTRCTDNMWKLKSLALSCAP